MKQSLGQTLWRCLGLICLFLGAGCSMVTPLPTATQPPPSPITTPTLAPIPLVNGRLEPCFLLNNTEVGNALGREVSKEVISLEITGHPACKYNATSGETPGVLLIVVLTDITLRASGLNYTAATWYEQEKKFRANLASEIQQITLQDLSDVGDKAYYRQGLGIEVYVLKNGIYYWFSTPTPEQGIGSVEKMIELTKIAMQRAP